MATSAKRQVLFASLSFTDAKAPILSVMAGANSFCYCAIHINKYIFFSETGKLNQTQPF